MTEISTDDDDDGWNDNYDGDGDNIDEIYDKITKKKLLILWLLSKYWPILGISTWWKEGQNFWARASPPPDSGNARK